MSTREWIIAGVVAFLFFAIYGLAASRKNIVSANGKIVEFVKTKLEQYRGMLDKLGTELSTFEVLDAIKADENYLKKTYLAGQQKYVNAIEEFLQETSKIIKSTTSKEEKIREFEDAAKKLNEMVNTK